MLQRLLSGGERNKAWPDLKLSEVFCSDFWNSSVKFMLLSRWRLQSHLWSGAAHPPSCSKMIHTAVHWLSFQAQLFVRTLTTFGSCCTQPSFREPSISQTRNAKNTVIEECGQVLFVMVKVSARSFICFPAWFLKDCRKNGIKWTEMRRTTSSNKRGVYIFSASPRENHSLLYEQAPWLPTSVSSPMETLGSIMLARVTPHRRGSEGNLSF